MLYRTAPRHPSRLLLKLVATAVAVLATAGCSSSSNGAASGGLDGSANVDAQTNPSGITIFPGNEQCCPSDTDSEAPGYPGLNFDAGGYCVIDLDGTEHCYGGETFAEAEAYCVVESDGTQLCGSRFFPDDAGVDAESATNAGDGSALTDGASE